VSSSSLTLAFTAGLVFPVNPCGFGLLPAYLSFFVGVDPAQTGEGDSRRGVGRALVVGLAVTAGFAATFGVIGLLVSHVTTSVFDVAPWLSLLIAAVLVVLGATMLAGYEPNLRLPTLNRGGGSRGLASMALFGVSYAIASVGCALPIFLTYVATSFGRNLFDGTLQLLAYTAGFFVIMTALSVALALTRQSLVHGLRRLLPYVHRLSGALLMLAGLYLAVYGQYELRTNRGDSAAGGNLITRVTVWADHVKAWLENIGATTVGLSLAVALAAAGAYALTRRTPGQGASRATDHGPAAPPERSRR
jgi:cytochrome c-type biogenesis protein